MTRSVVPPSPLVPDTDSRARHLEEALTRTALAYHFQHVMAKGPTWDDCEHPICSAAKRLLPTLRSGRDEARDRHALLSTRS
jgi:hypothetical protein